MKLVGFCYPLKEACLIYLLEIFLDTEKTLSEDYYLPLWDVMEVIINIYYSSTYIGYFRRSKEVY